MAVISHVWPGYTLLNIWELTYDDWVYLRGCADEVVKARG